MAACLSADRSSKARESEVPGAQDRLMSVEGARRLFAAIGSKDKALKIYDDAEEGGTIHCSHDYWAHNVPFMLDWLADRL